MRRRSTNLDKLIAAHKHAYDIRENIDLFPIKRTSLLCSHCGQEFESKQALGGHMMHVMHKEIHPNDPMKSGVYVGTRPTRFTGWVPGKYGVHKFLVVDGHDYGLHQSGEIIVDKEPRKGYRVNFEKISDDSADSDFVREKVRNCIASGNAYNLFKGLHCHHWADEILKDLPSKVVV